jgi:ATP adenylyltransferase
LEYFFNFQKMAYLKKPKPEGCILCLIGEGSEEVESLLVWENERFLVTVNLYPYNPAHLMIAPRRHVKDVRQLTTREETELVVLRRYILNILDSIYSPSAYNIGYNMGLEGGASIEHLHLHIIPRYPRELGIADLIAGKRVLVEDPRTTQEKIIREIRRSPSPL